jgi:hypothetical protein
VNDGITAREALDGLAKIGQVGQQRRRSRVSGRDDVHGKHVVPVFEQSADDRPSGLPTGAGNHDFRHG